jgi:RNA polymerase sigma factor (sigma-70 family)
MSEMHDQSDAQLLRDYAERDAEAAFAEIVTRHTDLVYSAALRQVYSPDLACDVTQSVFTDLARKARIVSANLSPEASLVGWLYRGTRFAARDLYRNEARRTQRERLAMEQLLSAPESTPDWEQLRPVLDDAMSELDDTDRDAVLLRYFKNHDLRTVGATLGISDDAAQKRVSRAVERLREFFAKRGVTVGASGLAVVISANAVQAAPVGLALTISTAAALTGTTLATTATVTATKAIAMITLQKTLLTVAVVGSVTTSLLIQQHRHTKAREADQLAQQQSSQLARLKTDNDRLSSLAALAGSSSANNPDELNRLREEAATLRQKTNGLAAMQKDRWELNSALAQARQDSQDTNVQHSAWSEDAKAKAKYSGQLIQALMEYATQHQNQFPTNLEEAATFVSARTGKDAGFTPDQFEIAYQGPLTALEKYAYPSLIFLIREKQPWKNTDGKWTKVYATVTGIEIISLADGNFDAFEKKHILLSESLKP